MNNKYTLITVTVFAAVFIMAGMLSVGNLGLLRLSGSEEVWTGEKMVIHKSPTCGCCGAYSSYIKKYGYDVEIHDTDELSKVKSGLGVPAELESCHTIEVAGYIVEGHIPHEVIEKLLSEKPDIKGVGMPGMPSGSPGMPGSKAGEFMVYEINHDGIAGGLFTTI